MVRVTWKNWRSQGIRSGKIKGFDEVGRR